MSLSITRRKVSVKLTVVILLLPLTVFAYQIKIPSPKVSRYDSGAASLVAKGSFMFYDLNWCGAKRIFYFLNGNPDGPDYDPRLIGSFVFSLKTFKAQPVSIPPFSNVIDCSRDGAWIIYTRKINRIPTLFRYEVATGKIERLADLFVRYKRTTLSPDQRSFVVRRVPRKVYPHGNPKWQFLINPVKLERFSEVIWRADSNSIFVRKRHRYGKIDQHGYITLEDGKYHPLKKGLRLINMRMDEKGRLYGIKDDKSLTSTSAAFVTIVRCNVQEIQLNCKEVLNTDMAREPYMPYRDPDYYILNGGSSILFRKNGNNCLWKKNVSTGLESCLLKLPIDHNIALSLDGRWVMSHKQITKTLKLSPIPP